MNDDYSWLTFYNFMEKETIFPNIWVVIWTLITTESFRVFRSVREIASKTIQFLAFLWVILLGSKPLIASTFAFKNPTISKIASELDSATWKSTGSKSKSSFKQLNYTLLSSPLTRSCAVIQQPRIKKKLVCLVCENTRTCFIKRKAQKATHLKVLVFLGNWESRPHQWNWPQPTSFFGSFHSFRTNR